MIRQIHTGGDSMSPSFVTGGPGQVAFWSLNLNIRTDVFG